MKISIIQLSDIHIKSNEDFIITHIDEFCKSCKQYINETSRVVVVISGDIAFSGTAEQYDIAYNFLKNCEKFWKKENKICNFDYVIVPGNHDCEFKDDAIREVLIKDVLQKGDVEDNAIIEHCLHPQKNFWCFYKKLIDAQESSISWLRELKIKTDFSLYFQCYNTAFLSTLHEDVGKLMIPQRFFLQCNEPNNLSIAVFHHNTGWLTPNNSSNNKKQFEKHLYDNAHIVMCGHEHTESDKIIADLGDCDELVYLESSAFQYDKSSKFNFYHFDTESFSLSKYSFQYNNTSYVEIEQKDMQIRPYRNKLQLNNTFLASIQEIALPLKHEKKFDLVLSDIFVYPDLEPMQYEKDSFSPFVDSENILENPQLEKVMILEGDSQSGKSSLLKMLYMDSYKSGLYPLLIKGERLSTHSKLKKIMKESYESQYDNRKYKFDKYAQLEKCKKVVFIDEINKSSFSKNEKSEFVKKLMTNFEKVIITTSEQIAIDALLEQSVTESDIKRYKLLPLGYYKRNQLIEKWVRIGRAGENFSQEAIGQEVKLTFDQITGLLGKQLIPSYPIFVLSLLQGLNQALGQFDVEQTSYAYCYNSLIIASLVRAEIPRTKINGMLNFLQEFAYYLYKEQPTHKYFSKEIFERMYDTYIDIYNDFYNCSTLLSKMVNANLIQKIDEDSYSFSYKYIFYFLVASKISTLIDDGCGEEIVKKLCSELHKEREANILIFLIYKNGGKKQIDELLFASWLPFEDISPITLAQDDKLFVELSKLVRLIKTDVIKANIDPRDERNRDLRKADELHRTLPQENFTEEDFQDNVTLRDLNDTFKVVKIMGQIVKNQKDSLDKGKLLDIIESSYNVCFRSISFFTQILDESQQEIVDFFINKNKGKTNEDVIKSKIEQLLHLMLLRVCLATFSNLSMSVGTSDLGKIYDEVARRIGTPAAKIISFTIKTYYNNMSMSDLESILFEFKNNPVALEIIKYRVIKYVYNHHLSYDKRQKISSICGLKLINNVGLQNKANRL
ncbi:metallophosphoesterase [Prevotella aurantiaca]